MFEQSLVDSAISGGRGLSRTGSIVAFSVGVQAALVAAFLVGPLLWPAGLPKSLMTPHMTSVSLSKPVVKVVPKQVVQTSASATAMPRVMQVEMTRGGRSSVSLSTAKGVDAPLLAVGSAMGDPKGTGLFAVLGTGTGPVVSVAAAKPAKPLVPPTISSGVMAGRLLAPIQPVYPRIAIAARIEGAVVVTATIDKNGRITGLQVLSGPAMLRTSAVEAVQEARYRPYLLNGEPTDVVTTITVNFRMGA